MEVCAAHSLFPSGGLWRRHGGGGHSEFEEPVHNMERLVLSETVYPTSPISPLVPSPCASNSPPRSPSSLPSDIQRAESLPPPSVRSLSAPGPPMRADSYTPHCRAPSFELVQERPHVRVHSQHSLASVLYKHRASQSMLSAPPSSSGRSSPDLEPEVLAATKALLSDAVDQQANAANTIANLALRDEHKVSLVESGAVERMVDLALHSQERNVHRFLAMSFCRIAQNGRLVPRLEAHDGWYPGLMALATSPNGTIWRQAARALALCTIHGKVPARVVEEGGLKPLQKLARADQLEFQTDAVRALLKLSTGPDAASIVGDGYWRHLLDVAKESSVPILTQFVAETLVNGCRAGGCSDMACEEGIAAVQLLLEKAKPSPACEGAASSLSELLDLLATSHSC
mmetsp:Transcript_26213/g.60556  ORF Transcript_26213/g.60556 Transcript_26213/m.60556 type:complete len:400 (+) Transcript_26213:148-1347(+)